MTDLSDDFEKSLVTLSKVSAPGLLKVAYRLAQDFGIDLGAERPSTKHMGCVALGFVASTCFTAANLATDEDEYEELVAQFLKRTEIMSVLKSLIIDWKPFARAAVDVAWENRDQSIHAGQFGHTVITSLLLDLSADKFHD